MNSNEPYPKTKQLVRIAKERGMRQVDIAKHCKVSQPTVQRWEKGERLAKRKDILPLIRKYGEHLQRTPFKLYQTAATSEEARKYVRVEGKLILREKFRGILQNSKTPTLRVSIQRQSSDQFALIIEVTNAPYPDRNKQTDAMPLITDRLAAWFLDGPLDHSISIVELGHLRDLTRHLASGENTKNFPTLEQLPFLVTEALLNHGYKLDDLVEYELPE